KKEYREDIIADVERDYAAPPFETQWRLNMNFYMGNQYCTAAVTGEITDVERDYYWQEREVFNHISSLVETRQAKLNTVRPSLTVRPFSSDDNDVKTAKSSTKILSAACDRLDIDGLLTEGTMWSEICGTAFYYVGWDGDKGLEIADGVHEGDVCVCVVSPFEIYPDNICAQNMSDCRSVIRARAVDVDEIKRVYGKSVEPEPSDVIGITAAAVGGGLVTDSTINKMSVRASSHSAVVIERYSVPSVDKPNGELAVVANGVLLFYGELPYVNGVDGRRAIPFIKQVSLVNAGCFFGASVVERSIPVQRAYNAVKNRKHEFMNRLSMGVMAVEDGSVDIDNLEQEGISPGKILVYRQGATPPRMVELGSVPSSFDAEEMRLLNEFTQISGVSEVMRSSEAVSANMSGVALQLLIEQDDTRLSLSAEYIRLAARELARHILRLYKQFGTDARLSRIVGSNGQVELMRWSASDISSDDVVFSTDNELLSTPAMRQNMMFELYKMGLLSDENGKMTDSAKHRFMEALGYGGWDSDIDLAQVHITRAETENSKDSYKINEFDDHALHIDAHIKYLLTECPAGKKAERVKAHIKEHRVMATLAAQAEAQGADIQQQGEQLK
ncbi:MAG: hypothetical protein NC548_59320, partial [Lachnospiraceae bacterium]|nr:hypothetical protein [Lachnospiraceae bacterium]